jgi:hypothetical protein
VRRRAALLLLLALAGGCADGGPAALPTGQVRADFAAGGVADTIYIDALDRLALRGAELVAPDGRTTAAGWIATQLAPSNGATLAVPTGSFAGAAIGGAAPSPVGAAVQSQSRLLAIVSNATITLPDPVAYRRDWRHYRIRLRFGNPPDTEPREIAAPAPPPPATL